MNTDIAVSRPRSFWVIAVLALLWNLVGIAMFYMQVAMTPEQLAAMPAEQRAVYEATPPWLDVAFAVAVFGGALAALGLLLGKRWAVPMFLLSLLGLLAQMLGAYAVTPAWSAYGAAGLAMPILLVAIAVSLVLYSRKAAVRGWIS